MSTRIPTFVLAMLPMAMLAQSPKSIHQLEPLNSTMRVVLLANRRERIAEAEWLRMMERPMNRSLYPLRVDQAMLDTLDVKVLDPRFRYEMVPAR